MSITPPTSLTDFLNEYMELDPEIRSELLIELGEHFEEVPASVATRPFASENKIPACESDAYLFTTRESDGTLRYYFAVENPQGVSAKALASLLGTTLSGQPLAAVAAISDEVVYTLFGSSISMGKGIGLRSMLREVAQSARRALDKEL